MLFKKIVPQNCIYICMRIIWIFVQVYFHNLIQLFNRQINVFVKFICHKIVSDKWNNFTHVNISSKMRRFSISNCNIFAVITMPYFLTQQVVSEFQMGLLIS